MLGDRARGRLSGTRFADVRWVAETGSTNADALALAADGAPEGVVVAAERQTAGRGRLDRTWTAPPGSSVLASVLLRPPAEVAGSVTMAASVGLVDAIAEVAEVSLRVKWPNDLVWPGDRSQPDRKVAGILAEADWPARANIAAGWQAPPPDERAVVVVGTGVNVNWPAGPPAELAETAIALNRIAGRDIDRDDLLAAYLLRLDGLYTHLLRSRDPEPLVARWADMSATLGRHVRMALPSSEFEGTAVDVTSDGRLVVETESGDRRVFASGDVVHLRSAEA